LDPVQDVPEAKHQHQIKGSEKLKSLATLALQLDLWHDLHTEVASPLDGADRRVIALVQPNIAVHERGKIFLRLRRCDKPLASTTLACRIALEVYNHLCALQSKRPSRDLCALERSRFEVFSTDIDQVSDFARAMLSVSLQLEPSSHKPSRAELSSARLSFELFLARAFSGSSRAKPSSAGILLTRLELEIERSRLSLEELRTA